MLPFWPSIGVLSLTQGALVALPGTLSIPWVERRRSRLWAAVPPLSVVAFVFGARAAERASTQSLTYLALVAVPVLAALALGWLERGARPALALLAPALFALAWVDRGGLAGQAAALALSALSCVALGVLLAAVTPPRWLAVGIVAMACADTALVVSELLQHPNEVLNAAHPALGLPRLQAEAFGSAAMGYGDLFVAGLLGGLLARGWPPGARSPRARQLRGGALVAVLALAFDLLFFAVDELPATVPVALGLILVALARQRAGRAERLRARSRMQRSGGYSNQDSGAVSKVVSVLVGVLASAEIQSGLSRLAEKLADLRASDAQPRVIRSRRQRTRRPGWVLDAVCKVMAEHVGPMRATQVQAAVEALVGGTVSINSISWVLAFHSVGPSPMFVRVARGRYVLLMLNVCNNRGKRT